MAYRNTKQRRSATTRRIGGLIKAYNSGSFPEATAAAHKLDVTDPGVLARSVGVLARSGRLVGARPVVSEMSFLHRVKARATPKPKRALIAGSKSEQRRYAAQTGVAINDIQVVHSGSRAAAFRAVGVSKPRKDRLGYTFQPHLAGKNVNTKQPPKLQVSR